MLGLLRRRSALHAELALLDRHLLPVCAERSKRGGRGTLGFGGAGQSQGGVGKLVKRVSSLLWLAGRACVLRSALALGLVGEAVGGDMLVGLCWVNP